jgi:hypothetical protein
MIAALGSRQGGVVALADVFMSVHRQTVNTQSIAHKVPVIFDGNALRVSRAGRTALSSASVHAEK